MSKYIGNSTDYSGIIVLVTIPCSTKKKRTKKEKKTRNIPNWSEFLGTARVGPHWRLWVPWVEELWKDTNYTTAPKF